MARVSTIITSFRAGEISPKLEGRIDLEKYNEAAQTLNNMIVYPSGGVTRRPGTYYAGNTKDNGFARLMDFQFSDEQAYILEFGNNYIRFYKDGGVLTEAGKVPTAITQASIAVVTSNSHGFTNGDRVIARNIQGMVELNNREFSVTGVTTNTFALSGVNSTNYTPATGGGSFSKIVEVATTYTAAQVPEINHAQSADVLYLAHKDHAPAKLTRTSATSFTLEDIDFVDGPYLDENITNTTLYASADTGTVTITASASLFTAADVGRLVRFREVLEIHYDEWEANKSYNNNDFARYNGHVYKHVTGSTQTSGNTPPVHTEGQETYGGLIWEYRHDDTGYAEITAYNSPTSVTAIVKEDDGGISVLPHNVVGSANATKKWSLGAFGGDQGFPRAIGFYEQRLYFAGTTGKPQSIFGSVSADFENHTPGTNDDDAVNITIASDQVNVIKHLLPARFLQILTTSAEFTLSGGTGATPVTPTNVNVLRETTFGTSDVRPLRAGNSTVLIQKGGEKVKEITFDLDTDGLLGIDLTILADHITRGQVTNMTWQQEPELILWFVHSDGRLIGLTYDRANAAIAWHDHNIGGPAGEVAKVESIASIPSGAEDQVYVSVRRYVNGVYVRNIEYISPIEFGNNVEDAFFVDGGLTYDSAPTTNVSGLSHLEGQTVTILADGATHADKVVSNGSVTLDRPSKTVHVGYSYTSTVETLRLEAGADDGISQGKIKRIHGVTARFYKTVGAEIGPDVDNLDRVPFRDSSMNMDEGIPIFTGDKEIYFPSGYETEARVVIRQSQPLPMTVLAIMRRSNTFDA